MNEENTLVARVAGTIFSRLGVDVTFVMLTSKPRAAEYERQRAENIVEAVASARSIVEEVKRTDQSQRGHKERVVTRAIWMMQHLERGHSVHHDASGSKVCSCGDSIP